MGGGVVCCPLTVGWRGRQLAQTVRQEGRRRQHRSLREPLAGGRSGGGRRRRRWRRGRLGLGQVQRSVLRGRDRRRSCSGRRRPGGHLQTGAGQWRSHGTQFQPTSHQSLSPFISPSPLTSPIPSPLSFSPVGRRRVRRPVEAAAPAPEGVRLPAAPARQMTGSAAGTAAAGGAPVEPLEWARDCPERGCDPRSSPAAVAATSEGREVGPACQLGVKLTVLSDRKLCRDMYFRKFISALGT